MQTRSIPPVIMNFLFTSLYSNVKYWRSRKKNKKNPHKNGH